VSERLLRDRHLSRLTVSATILPVIKYLHTLSAALFYILGASFFLAYILLHNSILTGMSGSWLQAGDLPLLLSGLLYGGLSVYRSIQEDDSSSHTLMLAIGIPVAVMFVLFLVLNFR